MKTNCNLLNISIFISSISFILVIILEVICITHINCEIIEFIKNIVLGIFCSSVITIFFYTSSYRDEKKRLLEQYWNEMFKMIKKLNKIEYFYTKYNEDIIINFFNERKQEKQNWIKEYNKINPDKQIITESKYTKLLIKEIKQEDIETLSELETDEAQEYFIQKRLDSIYKKIKNDMNRIIEEYIEMENYTTEKLSFILGDMKFFTGNKNYIKAYKLYKKISDLLDAIKLETYHFKLYKNGEGNQSVVLRKLFELQKEIFRVETYSNKDTKQTVVYNEFSDSIMERLEDFRAKIIYSINSEKINKIPVFEITEFKNKK